MVMPSGHFAPDPRRFKRRRQGLKIVRQSLPYGTASGTHGLYFCAYCARLYNIEQQLLSMFGDADGKRDAMLRFTKPVTGGYYFAFCRTSAVAVSPFCPLPVGGLGEGNHPHCLFPFQLPKHQTVYKTVTGFIRVINKLMVVSSSSYKGAQWPLTY
jgi:hypothetical protein